jgi:hypothetical protein
MRSAMMVRWTHGTSVFDMAAGTWDAVENPDTQTRVVTAADIFS